MKVTISCNYCGCSDRRTYFMLTLTSITNRSDSCTKVICEKCTDRLGLTLDAILTKRDIDDALKEIEDDLLNDQTT